MSTELRLRRGTFAEHASFTGANGELTADTTRKQLRLHDGATAGGHVVGDDENYKIERYGAISGGVVDASAAFAAACADALAAGGGVVTFDGIYLIDTALAIPSRVTVRGASPAPGELYPPSLANYGAVGSVLVVNSAITITTGYGASLSDCTVIRKGLTLPFADAIAAANGVAAFAGTAITLGGSDSSFSNLLILGFAKAIYGTGYERPRFHQVHGDCLSGIDVRACYDISRGTHCHFWPYTTTHQTWTTHALMERSGTAYQYKDGGDWNTWTECFSYGYANGFVVDSCDNVQIIGCGADYPAVASTSVGFSVLGTSNDTLLLGCQTAAQGHGVQINTAAGKLTRVESHSAWACDVTCITVDAGRVSIVSPTLRDGTTGIVINAGAGEVTNTHPNFSNITTPYTIHATALPHVTVTGGSFKDCADAVIGNRAVADNVSSSNTLSAHNTSGTGPSYTYRYSRGSADAPAISQASDQAWLVSGQLYDGVTWGQAVTFRGQASGPPAAGSTPGVWVWGVTPTGSLVPTDYLALSYSGGLYPLSDATRTLGNSAGRWLYVYSQNMVLTPPASVTPTANGEVMLQLTSDTSLALKVRGSDGVVRKASLPLSSSVVSTTPLVLAQSAVAVSHTGDTVEFTFATVNIPAGLMGANGSLRVTARYSHTGSTNNKTFRTRLGGTAFCSPGTVTAAVIGFKTQCNIVNRGSAASQIGDGDSMGLGGISVSYAGTVDTTVAQDITITGQLASAGETITLEYYLVELIPTA